MMDNLRKLWRDYNLSLVLLACFILSWVFQAWTGWREFAAEQAEHHQTAAVFGDSGYIWTFAAATFENWQSEFLQLLAMVVLTSFLIHRGSAESKDSNDRMEAKIDELREAVDALSGANGSRVNREKNREAKRKKA
jgi:hypothetical protein